MNICELLENTSNNNNNENQENERLEDNNVQGSMGEPTNDEARGKEEKPGSVYATSEDLSKSGDSSSEAMDTSDDEDDVDYNSKSFFKLYWI